MKRRRTGMILAVRRSDSAIQRVYARNRLDLSANRESQREIGSINSRNRHALSTIQRAYARNRLDLSTKQRVYTRNLLAQSTTQRAYARNRLDLSAMWGGSIRSNRRVPTWSHVSCLKGSKSQSLKSQRRGKTRQDMTMTWQATRQHGRGRGGHL